MLQLHKKGRRRGYNQSQRVQCRAGNRHNILLLGQVAGMEAILPLHTQMGKITAATRNKSRLPFLTDLNWKEQQSTTIRPGTFSSLPMINPSRVKNPIIMFRAWKGPAWPGLLPSRLQAAGVLMARGILFVGSSSFRITALRQALSCKIGSQLSNFLSFSH